MLTQTDIHKSASFRRRRFDQFHFVGREIYDVQNAHQFAHFGQRDTVYGYLFFVFIVQIDLDGMIAVFFANRHSNVKMIATPTYQIFIHRYSGRFSDGADIDTLQQIGLSDGILAGNYHRIARGSDIDGLVVSVIDQFDTFYIHILILQQTEKKFHKTDDILLKTVENNPIYMI